MMRVRVGRARCEGGCRRVLGEGAGAGAGLAHWGRREGDCWRRWVHQPNRPLLASLLLSPLQSSSPPLSPVRAVALARPAGEKTTVQRVPCGRELVR